MVFPIKIQTDPNPKSFEITQQNRGGAASS
jgi:hypothetical protein